MSAILKQPHAEDILKEARLLAHGGDRHAAAQRYRMVLEADGNHVEALYRLALLGESDGEESMGLLERALALQPGNPLLHRIRALMLAAQQRPLEALESMAHAAGMGAADADTLYNLGLLCAELCCPAQAEVYARRLLSQRPDWPAAHYLLVRGLTGQSKPSWELDAEYESLIKADPLNPSLRFARGLHQLSAGDYARGWEAQEWRWEIEPVKSARIESLRPRWAGGDVSGRRLLILGEQGYGDVLQFCRYLPQLLARGAHVILRLDANRAGLARLLRRIEGLEVLVDPPQLPPHELYCPLASLPYVFGTTPDLIPPAAYLSLQSADVDRWRERLSCLPRPWTGVCWAGSDEHDHNIRRSLPLSLCGSRYRERRQREQRIVAVAAILAKAWDMPELERAACMDALPAQLSLQPLLEGREGSFISLQMGPQSAEVVDLPPALQKRFYCPLKPSDDFYQTACLVRALDEVLSVDTAVAHVTGSVGQRGTVIKPAAPEWRWLARSGTALWYPSLTLLEQQSLPRTAAPA